MYVVVYSRLYLLPAPGREYNVVEEVVCPLDLIPVEEVALQDTNTTITWLEILCGPAGYKYNYHVFGNTLWPCRTQIQLSRAWKYYVALQDTNTIITW